MNMTLTAKKLTEMLAAAKNAHDDGLKKAMLEDASIQPVEFDAVGWMNRTAAKFLEKEISRARIEPETTETLDLVVAREQDISKMIQWVNQNFRNIGACEYSVVKLESASD